jgi:hypothetical protein
MEKAMLVLYNLSSFLCKRPIQFLKRPQLCFVCKLFLSISRIITALLLFQPIIRELHPLIQICALVLVNPLIIPNFLP